MTTPSDPLALLRSKSYLALPVLPAIIGLPVFVRRDEPIAAIDLIHGLGRAWSGRRFLRGTVGA